VVRKKKPLNMFALMVKTGVKFILTPIIDFFKLFSGITAVVWGYGPSSMVYFYSLAWLKNLGEPDAQRSFLQTFAITFGAASFSELLALWSYYPFDLIKTKMQTQTSGT